MGVARNTLIIFHVCQILLFHSIAGLPFASISAIPSLTSTETTSKDETQSQVSVLVNNENVLQSSSILTSPSKNFQLVIGLPFGNDNYVLPKDGASEAQTSSDTWSITAPITNIQPNVLSRNQVAEPTGSTDEVSLDVTPPSSSSVLFMPKINIDAFSNGFKRDSRDTVSVSSQESCLSRNSPSSSFSGAPGSPPLKPIFPCIKTPVEFTQLSNQNKYGSCESDDSNILPNSIECACALSSPTEGSSLFPKFNSNSNTFALNPINNRESCFADLKNYINSRQSVQCCSNSGIQNQLNIENMENNIPQSDMIRLNNNLMKAKALQNNMFVSQPIINNDACCENSINQNTDFMTEYQNVLRIRNDVIPKMLSDNIAVKSIAQNNNDNFQGFPQFESSLVQNNIPFIQNNNCEPETAGVPFSFNNIARIIKDNMNENNNNNLGCPQLRSIPIYNKESLLNRQAVSRIQNNLCLGQTTNENNQGCPQLLSIAQNSLYQTNNNEANSMYEQNCNCANECTQNQDNNCNYIQMFTPNENLAQALQMVNLAKRNEAQTSASINILPYGETLLDGKPISNSFISLDSLSCPAQLPSCPCSDFCNLQKKLSMQEVSVPISFTPVNPTNIMLNQLQSNAINTSPIITNIGSNIPNFATSNTQFSQSFVRPCMFNQDSCYSNNIQSFNPIVTPTFIPIQSLSQVPFVNNMASSTISVTPSLPLSDACISSISSLPSVCTSIQPIVSPPYPLITSNLKQTEGLSGASAAFTPINKIVNSLTKNILSTLITKKMPSATPLAKLPPVNPFASITESQSSIRPMLPFSDMPVACNEYVPPMCSSLIPISSFNPNLFCVESDSCDSCVPYALSITDTYYPESSLMLPALPSDYSCLCGSLYSPAVLPQASSVIKLNNLINGCC